MRTSGLQKNDIYLIDKNTFKTIAVDIKTCGDPVYFNYHGRWYLLDRSKVYSKNWIPKMIK